MNVGNFCTRRVMIVRPEDPVREAAHRMRVEQVGDLVVVEERDGGVWPVGILTDRDVVVRAVAKGATEVDRMPVRELMSSPLITARVEEDALVVARRMRRHGVRRVPIVDDRGQLAGIVTVDDLIGVLHAEVDELARLVTRRGSREGMRS